MFFLPLIVGLLTMTVVAGCSDDDEELQAQYGYVQFKLYKGASFEGTGTRATDRLDMLAEAQKVKVVMQYNGSTISQTLPLNSYNAVNAEFGLRSDKLQLLAGSYTIVGYYLYDKLDQLLLAGPAGNNNTFAIESGGLVVQPLTVDAQPRGMVSFKLIKEFVQTRAGESAAYPFGNIASVDITVKNLFTQETTTINKVKVQYKEGFANGSADEDLYPGINAETSYATCDTVAWLKSGSYQISSYTTYSDKNGKNRLETAVVPTSKTFVVKDNELTKEAEVPIRLSKTAEYIKDYLALKEIWEALGGEQWRYYGEAATPGSNWNFNKDIDMWGYQPGVQLHADGRVATLSVAGFGARGIVPDVIGQLTELRILTLGTHDEKLGGHLFANAHANMTPEEIHAIRMDYDKKFLARDAREGLSELLKEEINKDPSFKPIKSTRIQQKDVAFGNLTNNIVGISKAMMRLTKLQQFYIANSPISDRNFFREIQPESPYYDERENLSWDKLDVLTDIEIYNCPELTALPMEMLSKLPEVQLLNIACNKGISGEQLKADWEAFIEGNSGDKIQIIYMGYNNLKEFPTQEYLSKMVKLGMLDCAYNQIETLHPFGKDVSLVKFYLDYNKITKVPAAADGYFFGYNDVESFTISNNQITEFPDIFNAKSLYIMGSVDFSFNKISTFENGEKYRGINTGSLNLSNNRLEDFPSILFKTGSPLGTLVLSGNGMKSIPAGSLKGSKAFLLSSLDLSYNKLSELPNDFLATTIPYLYGIDMSYNRFSKFPTEPLNVDRLTVFILRHQRDDKGNRTLREWPTGIYTCPSLRALYLGSNDLRKIEDKISPNIFVFEIKDNPNISINLSEVCQYIQAGYYTLVYDKTQDIRGCDILDLEN